MGSVMSGIRMKSWKVNESLTENGSLHQWQAAVLMVPPCEELAVELFYEPKHAAIGEHRPGRPLCHYINGAATGTEVITHKPIYLQRDTRTTSVRLARGMSLYDILTIGPIGERDWVKKLISWCNIDNIYVKIKKNKMKQLDGDNA